MYGEFRYLFNAHIYVPMLPARRTHGKKTTHHLLPQIMKHRYICKERCPIRLWVVHNELGSNFWRTSRMSMIQITRLRVTAVVKVSQRPHGCNAQAGSSLSPVGWPFAYTRAYILMPGAREQVSYEFFWLVEQNEQVSKAMIENKVMFPITKI